MSYKPSEILVFCGDGHGIKTPGKRTPRFSDGSYIKENEFNTPTKLILFNELKRQGIAYVDVSPELSDTPLSVRTSRANKIYDMKKYKIYIYISIHYNAIDDDWDNSTGGIETYHYYTSKIGKALATKIHEQLIKGTPLKNRGVKQAGFYVLKYTKMPAVLVECGFMSNHNEAILMKNIKYQKECATEICKGICDYFGFKYKKEATSDLETYTKIISPVYYDVWLEHFKEHSNLNWEGFLASALSKKI